jgi:DNA polymerase-3 subunit epsilon
VPADELEAWLEQPLGGGLGALGGRAVLQRHGTDAWSQPGRPGEALLRLPLPAAEPVLPAAAAATAARAARPPRPEFYDFDLLARGVPEGDLAERPLAELSYLVFDFETTGLRPSAGDRPVSLGAVRVVNGRVLTMETFERLIDPGRPIPTESTRFHGITDAMVEGKPPLDVVLPQFHRFAAESVLVAHNAAFELAFLEAGAAACGLSFDQPVLDTLLLSAYLDGPDEDHALDAIAARYGLGVAGRRHTALADALLTAAILVRQIERLADERGLVRLGQLVAATNMLAQLRANRARF